MIPLRDTNPRRTFPFVTYALVAVNILAFLWELSLGPNLERALYAVSFIPARFWIAGNWVADLMTIAISMFLHGGLLHIGSNMLYLWIFGDNIEDRLGHGRFLIFYLACGYLATLAHAFFSPGSRVPAIGASGAIAGVLGAYLLLFPHARVLTLIPIFFFITLRELPAVIILGLWFVLQLFSGVGSLGVTDAQDLGGVAYFAHIGGFVSGMLLIAAFGGMRSPRRREPPPPWWAQR
jgi:membrane associated rhomboid family serine protease